MRKFYQNKLWRDKLIKIREEKGAIIHSIPLSHVEFNEELGMKLLEEANEVYAAETPEEMMDEIADVLEVLDCILQFHGISKEETVALQEKKRLEGGSYTDQRLIDYVEYPAGSKEEQHCLANPDRYPELIEEDDDDLYGINQCCKK